ncbi:Tyrosine-protein kinase isoform SRK1 [Holothuria leucospilota]|uniref:Tyrosine-protein kinase isoform SRK1 n=1 Tax=Holothuria leucospilota TaxID=206669 RepID=A0A9Q0YMK3_HOLLE|nr:Tyrosine-protein kinase isoform SRK1 [Holothuria leucospilota]
MLALNNHHDVILVLLYLSTVFDAFDHDLLAQRLRFGFEGAVMDELISFVRDALNRLLLHPGLSTKKVLLTNKGICKLYDFCLSEDASNTVRIRKSRITCTLNQLPPEALLRDKYSKASDVWSVAVVIWEILSCGILPFPNEEQSHESEKAVYSLPETWPTNYKLLRNEQLLKGWNEDTSLRPTIYQLKSSFAKSFEELDTYGPSNTSTDDLASSYVRMKGLEKSADDS